MPYPRGESPAAGCLSPNVFELAQLAIVVPGESNLTLGEIQHYLPQVSGFFPNIFLLRIVIDSPSPLPGSPAVVGLNSVMRRADFSRYRDSPFRNPGNGSRREYCPELASRRRGLLPESYILASGGRGVPRFLPWRTCVRPHPASPRSGHPLQQHRPRFGVNATQSVRLFLWDEGRGGPAPRTPAADSPPKTARPTETAPRWPDAAQVTFKCEACDTPHRWRPHLAGKKAKCPCGHVMTVPVGPAAHATSPEPPRRETPPKTTALRLRSG